MASLRFWQSPTSSYKILTSPSDTLLIKSPAVRSLFSSLLAIHACTTSNASPGLAAPATATDVAHTSEFATDQVHVERAVKKSKPSIAEPPTSTPAPSLSVISAGDGTSEATIFNAADSKCVHTTPETNMSTLESEKYSECTSSCEAEDGDSPGLIFYGPVNRPIPPVTPEEVHRIIYCGGVFLDGVRKRVKRWLECRTLLAVDLLMTITHGVVKDEKMWKGGTTSLQILKELFLETLQKYHSAPPESLDTFLHYLIACGVIADIMAKIARPGSTSTLSKLHSIIKADSAFQAALARHCLNDAILIDCGNDFTIVWNRISASFWNYVHPPRIHPTHGYPSRRINSCDLQTKLQWSAAEYVRYTLANLHPSEWRARHSQPPPVPFKIRRTFARTLAEVMSIEEFVAVQIREITLSPDGVICFLSCTVRPSNGCKPPLPLQLSFNTYNFWT